MIGVNTLFYPNLAVTNIRKNKRTYFPYMLISICTIAMFYILESIGLNKNVQDIYGGITMTTILNLGAIVIGIFSWIIIFYTNTFLIKRRKKELGLYTILGMAKKHLAIMIFFETLFIALCNIIIGLGVGLLLSKLMFLVLLKLIGIETILEFSISVTALIITVILFMVIFMMTLVTNILSIRKANPVQLLSGAKSGEKEPKSKWILTIIGLIFLGAGYYLAVTTKSPLEALGMFFIAVIFVMIGTYALFTSGTITVLKMLKKNEKYYYKTKHFISVSGLIYRMKQNAAGLANICILSSAVLVTVSTTVSLYLGTEDTLLRMYPYEYSIQALGNYKSEDSTYRTRESLEKAVNDAAEEAGVSFSKYVKYEYNTVTCLSTDNHYYYSDLSIYGDEALSTMTIISSRDYEVYTNTKLNLSDSEALIYSENAPYSYDTIDLFGIEYEIKGTADRFMKYSTLGAGNTLTVVVNDLEALNEAYNTEYIEKYETRDDLKFIVGADLDKDTDEADIAKFTEIMNDKFYQTRYLYLNIRAEQRMDVFSMYGGLLFIGVFLGILFLMATVMIIYYKQVSEGYDDKDRFVIMQKVGMSRQEVKRSIRSQILTVFFFPLITAFIHICFAFPLMNRLLELLSLPNMMLFVFSTIACVLIFALIYTIVFILTARTYYKIVGS